MSAFEIVIIVVAVLALLSALTPWFGFGGLRWIGRIGGNWFDHADETPIQDRPSEDDRDAPLPRRPIRGRPDFRPPPPAA